MAAVFSDALRDTNDPDHPHDQEAPQMGTAFDTPKASLGKEVYLRVTTMRILYTGYILP